MFVAINLRKSKKGLLSLCFVVFMLFIAFVYHRYPLKYVGIIRENAAFNRLDPSLVCAVIHAESKFIATAKSRKGASGLMQITEGTAGWMAEKMDRVGYSYENIFEPSLNIQIGCNYLRWLLDKYSDNIELAVAAYNAGSGNVDKWLKNADYSTDGFSLNRIPFQETKDYVWRVRWNKKIYDLLFLFIK